MTKAITKEEFIRRAKEVYGEDRYLYDRVIYKTSHEKVLIGCPKHEYFETRPYNFLAGKGCPKCYKERRNVKATDTESFKKAARKIHGDKYDYSRVKYINSQTKIKIICPIHGEFEQTPNSHMSGEGCKECANDALRGTKESFIKSARKVHGNRYNYDRVIYVNDKTPVKIICPIHGEFEQKPNIHIQGCGCKKCTDEKMNREVFDTESFITKAREVHGDEYDYSKVNYINSTTPITIICPKHGEFDQIPNNHLKGNECPQCSAKVSTQETMLVESLQSDYNEEIIQSSKKVLGTKELDIYLPDHNIGIEVNGNYWHSECIMDKFKKSLAAKEHYENHQKDKFNECSKLGVKLFNFYGDEVINHIDLIKSIVLSYINDYPKAKTKIKEINQDEAFKFYQLHSLNWNIKAEVHYGLIDKQKRIRSLISFKRIKKNNEKWKIVNWGVDNNSHREFKTIIDYFIEQHSEYKKLVTYSDNRFDNENLLNDLEFKFVKDIDPDYYYTQADDKFSRFSKSSIENSIDDPEEEGYYKLWDAGRKKWIYKV